MTARLLWADGAADSFSTSGVRDPAGRSGRFAGARVEGRFRHWLIRGRLRLETAFALLFRDRLLTDAPNAPPGRTLVYLAPAMVASFRSSVQLACTLRMLIPTRMAPGSAQL